MSEYPVRGWLAWHHHIALVMSGLLFVLTEKSSFREEYPLLTAADIRQIIVESMPEIKTFLILFIIDIRIDMVI